MVAAKALGMNAEVFQRILLFLNPVIGQSVRAGFELSAFFDELNPAAAEHMLTIWRTTGGHVVRRPTFMYLSTGMTSATARARRRRGTRRVAEHRDGRPARFKSNDRR